MSKGPLSINDSKVQHFSSLSESCPINLPFFSLFSVRNFLIPLKFVYAWVSLILKKIIPLNTHVPLSHLPSVQTKKYISKDFALQILSINETSTVFFIKATTIYAQSLTSLLLVWTISITYLFTYNFSISIHLAHCYPCKYFYMYGSSHFILPL